jgi:hypothetical protein
VLSLPFFFNHSPTRPRTAPSDGHTFGRDRFRPRRPDRGPQPCHLTGPFLYHVDIVRSAIKGKANVAISGHISTSLEAVVKKAGTAVLYEIGVDPRTHQLYAPRHITSIHAMGGKVSQVVILPLLPTVLITRLGGRVLLPL